MRYASLLLFLFCLTLTTACRQREPVAVSNEPAINFPAVLERAKNENKHVLLEFTGSDWCPPCIAMHENVFSKPQFKEYIQPHIIFVVVDFPNEKPQSEEQKKVNKELSRKYDAEGLPTFVLLDPNGTEIWRQVGMFASTPDEFIAAIEAVKKNSAPKKS